MGGVPTTFILLLQPEFKLSHFRQPFAFWFLFCGFGGKIRHQAKHGIRRSRQLRQAFELRLAHLKATPNVLASASHSRCRSDKSALTFFQVPVYRKRTCP